MLEGVDYAWARPSPAGLYAAGKRFACRYLYGSTAGKAITRAELAALHAAGLDVVLIWEHQAAEAKGGYDAGRDRARRAADCVRALGAPSNVAVYFCVDYDETDLARARDYFRGIVSVWPKERTGIYGGRRVIQAAKDQGWCRWLWQTYAWSGGVWVPGAHLQQYRNGVTVAGGDVDLCRAMTGEFGQWRSEGDDMTPEEHQWLREVRTALCAPKSWRSDRTTARLIDDMAWVLIEGRPGTETTWIYRTLAAIAERTGITAEELAQITAAAREGAAAGVAAAAEDVVDEAELARQVLAALPPELARQVVDEAAARLGGVAS